MAALVLLAAGGHAFAEPLPVTPIPDGGLSMTFEIVAPEPGAELPAEVRDLEGGRLAIETKLAAGERYRKMTLVLPIPGGDTRERVVYFVEEGGRLRMLGYHRIRRHHDSPIGETLVFQSGGPNPLTGTALEVAADTYSRLSLCGALAGAVEHDDAPAARLRLRVGGGEAVPAEVVNEGRESLSLLGTRVSARRLRVRPENAAPGLYWFAEAPPHGFLQYRGPAEFLTEKEDGSPSVLLRATSSSEQVKKVFGD
jgi:hypothetical protein